MWGLSGGYSDETLRSGIVRGKRVKKTNTSPKREGEGEWRNKSCSPPLLHSEDLSECPSGSPLPGSWAMLGLHLASFVKAGWNVLLCVSKALFTAFNFLKTVFKQRCLNWAFKGLSLQQKHRLTEGIYKPILQEIAHCFPGIDPQSGAGRNYLHGVAEISEQSFYVFRYFFHTY